MSEFTLTVLGCDGSWPGPGGACSSYLLRSPTTSIALDMGTGSLANLQQHVAPVELDAVFLSHEHPDHCADIHALDVLLSLNGVSGLPVYATAGVKEQMFPRWEPKSAYEWVVIEDGDQIEIGDINLTVAQAEHTVATHAVRADYKDRSLVYTSDTDASWQMSQMGSDINLALCQAAFPESVTAPMHMNSAQAARSAVQAGAERLMLTHIRPGYDREQMRKEAESAFDGTVLIAATGNTYEV